MLMNLISDNYQAIEYEEKYVKNIYNIIAPHFDITRNCPWPGVQKYLDKLPDYSSIIELGCGNGRNLVSNRNLTFKGIDNSEELVKICQNKNLNVELGDCLDVKENDKSYDYVLSIAVIGHLSTPERRLKAFDEIFRISKKGGMIELWSLEQNPEKPNKKIKPNQKDQLITWTIRPSMEIVERYYHLFDNEEVKEIMNYFENKFNKEDRKINYRIYFDTDNWIIEYNFL